MSRATFAVGRLHRADQRLAFLGAAPAVRALAPSPPLEPAPHAVELIPDGFRWRALCLTCSFYAEGTDQVVIEGAGIVHRERMASAERIRAQRAARRRRLALKEGA